MSGSNFYRIIYAKEAKQDIVSLDSATKVRVREAIEKRLMTNPIYFGKPLRYSLSGLRRLRVGDWRVIFKISENEKTVKIVAVKHRREVYRKL